jgi:hypothetical protein
MEYKLRFSDEDDFSKSFEKAYNDHNTTGGLPDELVDEYHDNVNPDKKQPKLKILGNSDREYLSFIIGGLSTQTDMSDSRKSRAMHSVANRLGISHDEAKQLLKTLMANNNIHLGEYEK